jgi:glycosyltransferase involved in cell wall biosynthesis
MPRVFVFIPAYNAEQFIATAIESVIAQTYEDWILEVIDDCSTDGTFAIAQRFNRHPKISVRRNERNLGMVGNWNHALKSSELEFWVKLDADDYWANTFLQESIAVMDRYPSVGLVFTKYINVRNDNMVVEESRFSLPEFARDKIFDCVPLVCSGPDEMLSYPILRQGISLVRMEISRRFGGYHYLLTKETLASSDTEFYFRLGCHCKIYCIDKELYFYRVHPGSISESDFRNGLGERKIFEIKTVIVDYYYSHGRIPLYKRLLFHRKIKFDYLKNRVYRLRMNGNLASAVLLLMRLFIFHPVNSCRFYWGRITKGKSYA